VPPWGGPARTNRGGRGGPPLQPAATYAKPALWRRGSGRLKPPADTASPCLALRAFGRIGVCGILCGNRQGLPVGGRRRPPGYRPMQTICVGTGRAGLRRAKRCPASHRRSSRFFPAHGVCSARSLGRRPGAGVFRHPLRLSDRMSPPKGGLCLGSRGVQPPATPWPAHALRGTDAVVRPYMDPWMRCPPTARTPAPPR
jgi:hypothetical protein